jgi:hypothetical protein
MGCGGTTVTGRPCGRRVRKGAQLCAYHARRADGQVYGAALAARDRPQITTAGLPLDGVDAELVLLRLLARQVVAVGDVDSARRVIEAIARLVRLQHKLAALEHPERGELFGQRFRPTNALRIYYRHRR